MSVNHAMYLGGYIILPHGNWDDVVKKLKLYEDEFSRVPRSKALISNYTKINRIDDNGDRYNVIDLTPEYCEAGKKPFIKEHREVLDKLNQYFGEELPIHFGFISYSS